MAVCWSGATADCGCVKSFKIIVLNVIEKYGPPGRPAARRFMGILGPGPRHQLAAATGCGRWYYRGVAKLEDMCNSNV